ncbi:MAG: AsmA-like C-terminal region-containing protein, partial [Gammaproteobacteria bacterium]|nr:AsmA-like C-terminal region-containing protein [Gammaproteobacteria bacterium]
WFTRLNRNISVIRKRIKKVSNDCYLVIVQQLNRIPEPAWVAVVGKIYNEHEGIARIRNISKKKIISGEKAHARTIIWSMVFVIVTYSMFHKALEFAYKSDIENELGIFFDRKINIDSLEFGFFPGVKLLARGVSSSNFEGKPDARIQSIYLGVNFSELLWGDLNINYLHLDHATVDQDFLLGLPATFNKPQSKTDESSSLNINTFTAGPVKVVTDSNKSLGDYRVTVVMTPEKNLKLVKVMPASSSNMTLVITPYNEIFRFDLQASNWKIPGEYSIVLKSADVKGTLNNAKLVTSEMKGELYGGSFNGNLSLMWSDKINLNSSIRLDNVDSGKLLQSAGQKIITGKMDYKGILNINDMGSGDTWPNTYIKADFRFKNGVIHKADLEKASSLVNKNGTRGGQTRFDEFKGKIFSESGNMQLKNIEISSSALAAQGYLKVSRNNKLDGEVDVGLNNTKGILSIPLKISGVIDEPTLRPTNEAMAGAAIGTAILPGIGTALGVKVGKAVSWFKNVIKEDKDKQVK